MVSARASAAQVADLAKGDVEIACINGAGAVVLAGPQAAMEGCILELDKRGIEHKRLQTEHAFHTAAVESFLPKYKEALQSVQFSPASLPVLSNVTGEWHQGQTS